MPGVICYRVRPQDCASLGHLYRSSPNAARALPVRTERYSLPRLSTGDAASSSRYALEKSLSLARVSLPVLLLLSPEVVLLVLAELPGLDILRCRSVCKLLKLFIDHSAKLRYIVEAHARGLEPFRNDVSAQHLISQLLARERSWTMIGSAPDVHLTLGPPLDDDEANDEGPPPVERILYDSGRVLVCRGSRLATWTLGPARPDVREYVVPGLRDIVGNPIVTSGDWVVFSTPSAVHVYSLANSEIVRVLPVPPRGTICTLRLQGNFLAALFCPERQSSGVLVWNWKTGQLIDTLHSAGAPTLAFAFLNQHDIAVVRTNRSACSARIDIYTISSSCAFIRSSLALPDAHPSKWYAKAGIYAGGMTAPPGCEPLRHDRGVVAISLKLRVRSPHDPTTVLANRKLSTILVIDKKAVAHAPTITSPGPGPIPWPKWSSNCFRVLSNVRLATFLHSSPVWGYRIIALGPEPDQVALFDFCSVGAKAASVVWKAPGARGSTSIFSGGGGGRINGGVSVRAALAQRARTLVRANSLGIGAGWFEGMGVGVGGVTEQMPYVVSIRRGMSCVESAAVDGERVVILKNEEINEGTIVSRVTSFVFPV